MERGARLGLNRIRENRTVSPRKMILLQEQPTGSKVDYGNVSNTIFETARWNESFFGQSTLSC